MKNEVFEKYRSMVLNMVKYTGKRKPTILSVKKRGNYGINILNEILRKKFNEDDYNLYISLGLEIVKCLYIYEDKLRIPLYSLYKVLISLYEKCTDENTKFSIFKEILEKSKSLEFNETKEYFEIKISIEIIKLKNKFCETNLNFILSNILFTSEIFQKKVYKILEKEKSKNNKKLKNLNEHRENNEIKFIDKEMLTNSSGFKLNISRKLFEIKNFKNLNFNKNEIFAEEVKFSEVSVEEKIFLRKYFYFLKELKLESNFFKNIFEDEEYVFIKHIISTDIWSLSFFDEDYFWNPFFGNQNNLNESKSLFLYKEKYNECRNEYSEIIQKAFLQLKAKKCNLIELKILLHYLKKIIKNTTKNTNFNLINIEILFLNSLIFILEENYLESKNLLRKVLLILRKNNFKNIFIEIYLHVYNLIALSHFYLAEYFESVYYLDKSLDLIEEYGLNKYKFNFINRKLFVERFANIYGVSPNISLDLFKRDIQFKNDKTFFNEKKKNLNNRILFNSVLNEIIDEIRELRLFEFSEEDSFKNLRKENFENSKSNKLGNNCGAAGNLDLERRIYGNSKFSNEKLGNSFFKSFCNSNDFYRKFEIFYKRFSHVGLFSFYSLNDILCINFYFFDKNIFECKTQKTKIDLKSLKNKLNKVLSTSRETLKMKVESATDKKTWWDIRYKLDKELRDIIFAVNSELKEYLNTKNINIIILDESTTFFPFESMKIFENVSVYRIPSVEFLFQRLFFESKKILQNIFYVLDPENNLPDTRSTIKPFLETLNFTEGIEGKPIDFEIIREILQKDLFLYFGHGNGERYFKPYLKEKQYISKSKEIYRYSEKTEENHEYFESEITNRNLNKVKVLSSNYGTIKSPVRSENDKIMLLFGCSSAKVLCVDNFKRNGIIYKYLKKFSTILGCLWDVTDKDIDRFSLEFLDNIFKNETLDLAAFVQKSKKNMKLKYLNGASLVIYGMPVILDFKEYISN
ncbi:hypothetical protein LUQ84_001042 [Hamiltosporidium tvaerminnensis]|nr:hypothetical protein LUQ84_001042 [Hamiltosporidium tvaerminnensis]